VNDAISKLDEVRDELQPGSKMGWRHALETNRFEFHYRQRASGEFMRVLPMAR